MEREPRPGELVVIVRNSGDHPGCVGDRLIVSHVDDGDSTFRGLAQGSKSVSDFWISWSDVEPVMFSWRYARRHLPSDIAKLLDACDGIEFISLNRDLKEMIVDALPDWRDRVMAAITCTDRAEDEDNDMFDD